MTGTSRNKRQPGRPPSNDGQELRSLRLRPRLRPQQNGVKTTLFDLEARVMEVIWSNAWQTFAVGDVHRELNEEREIAYTTVMTTLSRLHEKGVVSRVRQGKRYDYSPNFSRESFMQNVAGQVLQGLSELDHNQTVALLAQQVTRADHDALDQLEAMIRQRRNELEGK
jgi:predicted transcriptional regulator